MEFVVLETYDRRGSSGLWRDVSLGLQSVDPSFCLPPPPFHNPVVFGTRPSFGVSVLFVESCLHLENERASACSPNKDKDDTTYEIGYKSAIVNYDNVKQLRFFSSGCYKLLLCWKKCRVRIVKELQLLV